jgi:quercetin dioxygenase-like cupin family protein
MTEVSIVGPGEGEVALSGTTQMRILEDGRTTSHRLGVGEITIAPRTEGPPQHQHARHDEGFYVGVMARYATVPATDYPS